MGEVRSYGKVLTFGSAGTERVIGKKCFFQEKVDGSQFSMRVDVNGRLSCRSKGQEIDPYGSYQKMFGEAVETAISLKDKLTPGFTYRCEYLQKPKHNALAYDRVPKQHLMVFDIEREDRTYLQPVEIEVESDRLGLEAVQLISIEPLETVAQVEKMLGTVSSLGGQKVEGVVIKPLIFTMHPEDKDKRIALKLVSPEFKEVHGHKTKDPNVTDPVLAMALEYNTPTRWNKALQHLKEDGHLNSDMTDIGKAIKEIQRDILEECLPEIKDRLFEIHRKAILNRVVYGFAEWYKAQLIQNLETNTQQAAE